MKCPKCGKEHGSTTSAECPDVSNPMSIAGINLADAIQQGRAALKAEVLQEIDALRVQGIDESWTTDALWGLIMLSNRVEAMK